MTAQEHFARETLKEFIKRINMIKYQKEMFSVIADFYEAVETEILEPRDSSEAFTKYLANEDDI